MSFFSHIRHIVCLKTYPGKNSLGKAVIFRHIQDRICNHTSESTKIAGIRTKINLTYFVDYLVKSRLKPGCDSAFYPFTLICRNRIIFIMLIQKLNHLNDDLRTLLKIGINYRHIFSDRLLKSGIYTGLFSEITGKTNDLYILSAGIIQFF